MKSIHFAACCAAFAMGCLPVPAAEPAEVNEQLQKTERAYISLFAQSQIRDFGPLLETAALLNACESDRKTPWLERADADIDGIVSGVLATGETTELRNLSTEISAGVYASLYYYREGYTAAAKSLFDTISPESKAEICDTAEMLADRIERGERQIEKRMQELKRAEPEVGSLMPQE